MKPLFLLPQPLVGYSQAIERELNRLLPPTAQKPFRLHRAMRYSVLAGGKRIRPLLCVAVTKDEGGGLAAALPVAAALECLHAYTLIHDDLPAMDDDALRRGKPTNHIVFGEATAILAGDALLTLVFEILATALPAKPYTTADLIREVAQAAGSRGVIGGQVEDIAGEGQRPTAARLGYIHQHKTADLLTAALVCGAMMAGVKQRKINLYTELGTALGLAFQLTDDVMNEHATEKELGKAVKSDKRKQKITGVSVWGTEKTKERIQKLYEECDRILLALEQEDGDLATLVGCIMGRKN